MNREAVQNEINKIIQTHRQNNPGQRQYPASKKYMARAEELGILDMIPEDPFNRDGKPGNTEIQIIIAAAEDAGTAVFNAEGEGEQVNASALYVAINASDDDGGDDDDNETAQDSPATFSSDDMVFIEAHLQQRDTYAGATHSEPILIQVGGHDARLYDLWRDYNGTVFVETSFGVFEGRYIRHAAHD